MTALVSIIVPAYNSSNTILDTIKSIDEQTYTNFECIIV
ncbi:glycosyltransferase, partial [Acinetobacter nosocomialis]